RGAAAHRAAPGHAHRPDLVLRDVQPGRASVRFERPGLALPGPVHADPVGGLPGLRAAAQPGQAAGALTVPVIDASADWRADLDSGTSIALVQAGTFTSD